MYSVFPSRAAGRIIASTILLSATSLLGACSTGMERLNYPAFGLSDSGNTASLPVPSQPMLGRQGRTTAPEPDYNNRPVFGNQHRQSNNVAGNYGGGNNNRPLPLNNNGRIGQGQNAQGQNAQGQNAQGQYGSNQQYGGGQQQYDRGRNFANNNGGSTYRAPNNNNNSYGTNSHRDNSPNSLPRPANSYGQQNSYSQQTGTRVARLPDRAVSRGPLPTRDSIPQVTYNKPEPTRSKPHRRNAASGRMIEVSQGQTLYGIAKSYGVNVADIKTVNNLQSNSVRLGQKLIIPVQGGHQQTAYVAPTRAPAANNARRVRTEPIARNRNTGRVYRVARGDSLYGIARRHGMTTAELAQINGIRQSSPLRPGQTLSVTKGGELAPARNAAKPANQAISAPRQVARLPQKPTVSRPLPKPKARAAGRFRWPVEGRIISRFGSKTNGTHNDGVNLAVPAGTSVRAAENGVVAYSGNELKGYGNLILVRHANDWVSAYAHVEKILVRRGDKISRGQVIAKSGKTGDVNRPQVHFELRKNSKPVNPLTHLASR